MTSELEMETVRRRNVEEGVQRTASSDGRPLIVSLDTPCQPGKVTSGEGDLRERIGRGLDSLEDLGGELEELIRLLLGSSIGLIGKADGDVSLGQSRGDLGHHC